MKKVRKVGERVLVVQNEACVLVAEMSYKTCTEAMGDSPIMSDTGATFNDVPIMSRRSTCSLSASKHFSKLSVSFSPKNVISGWAAVSERRIGCRKCDHLHYPRREQSIVLFIIITVRLAATLLHAVCHISRSFSGITAAFAQRHLSLHNFSLDEVTRNADVAI